MSILLSVLFEELERSKKNILLYQDKSQEIDNREDKIKIAKKGYRSIRRAIIGASGIKYVKRLYELRLFNN